MNVLFSDNYNEISGNLASSSFLNNFISNVHSFSSVKFSAVPQNTMLISQTKYNITDSR